MPLGPTCVGPMRIGIEIANDHLRPRASAVAAMARAAERLGYATVWIRGAAAAPAGLVDPLLVAAGATVQLRLGISTPTESLGPLIELLGSCRSQFGTRLTVAVAPEALRTPGRAAELADVAGVLVCSVVLGDIESGSVRGIFATGVASELDAARTALASVPSGNAPLELVVRVSVPSNEPQRVTDELLAVHAAGVDEVVLAAENEPSVDRAMAVYAALAESLETAGQPGDISIPTSEAWMRTRSASVLEP